MECGKALEGDLLQFFYKNIGPIAPVLSESTITIRTGDPQSMAWIRSTVAPALRAVPALAEITGKALNQPSTSSWTTTDLWQTLKDIGVFRYITDRAVRTYQASDVTHWGRKFDKLKLDVKTSSLAIGFLSGIGC